MNRQTKKEIRRLAVKILVAVLALGLAFWGYAFVYRGKTEPPAKYPVTNQDAAVYSLRGQIQMLSQQEELNTFAFEGRKKEKEYGTYIIPGLRYTRTFLNAEGTKQAVCTSMTPQGLAVTDEYVLVSAYCHTEKHNSVIYVINKETHRFIKEVVLPGLPHVGGLAYDQEHDMLWYSSNTNGIAQAISIKMDVLRDYNYADNHMPVQVNQTCSLYGIVRDSFMTFYKGCLYVGCFNKYTESTIARYAVDSKGDLALRGRGTAAPPGGEAFLLPLFNIEMRHSTYCPPSRSGKSWLSFGWTYHSTQRLVCQCVFRCFSFPSGNNR